MHPVHVSARRFNAKQTTGGKLPARYQSLDDTLFLITSEYGGWMLGVSCLSIRWGVDWGERFSGKSGAVIGCWLAAECLHMGGKRGSAQRTSAVISSSLL